ncbi:MAG: ATP-dependent helicase HrpB [Chitinispirillaceae bacterium]|nr:ATP-dependent helicase HrpB [Chitinispirillaceae bacterium]
MDTLPILAFREEIISSITNGRHLVITAPTGSGKSTQIPQMLLDSGLFSGRILLLQPRRLAARMLATRVARERGSELGGEIGFQTRFENAVSKATRACFITEGILPRMLLSNRILDGVSAIVFDEFHERNLATDIGLAMAMDLAANHRSDLRLIVMSATINTGPVAAYLGNATVIDCPGRRYPIDMRYTAASKNTPPWNTAADAVRRLVTQGAAGDILVFMPGAYEIRRTVETIQTTVRGEPITVLPLYGDLPSARQQEVMERLPHRKVIVATNIAETSLTIPGVRHVVDSGLARVSRYDAGRGFNTLFVEPISRDAADQRAGRAGREAAGICIRLWSAVQHTSRAEHTPPEISRVDLAETLLQLHVLGFESPDTVAWFDAPEPAALRSADQLLRLLGAFTPEGQLTQRGKDLCSFPMHPRLGTLLLEAGNRGAAPLAAFSAAVLSERPAFSGRIDAPEEALRVDMVSDLYTQYCLLEKIRKSGFDRVLATRYAVNLSAARSIYRTQALFLQCCRRAGMGPDDGPNAPEEVLCRALLAAYPDHLCARRDKGTALCRMRDNRGGELDKGSIVRKAPLFVATDIREIKNARSERKTVLSLAAEIRESWLHEDFPDAWEIIASVEWDQSTAAVVSRTRIVCLGVVITDEMAAEGVDPEAAAALLAETIISKKLTIDTWNSTVEEWLGRIGWLAERFPDRALPSFNENERKNIVALLCRGERQYEAVRKKPVLPVVQGMLSPADRTYIERMTPDALVLPGGRKMRLLYKPGAPPRGRAKIQELYGCTETPKIAGGKVPVLIEVLAPNNRPVQITDDLGRFWKEHYPGIRKTLCRRYPKHEWK